MKTLFVLAVIVGLCFFVVSGATIYMFIDLILDGRLSNYIQKKFDEKTDNKYKSKL